MIGKSRGDLLRVCYGKYGCFSIDYPWFSTHRLINMIPKGPDAIWPNFLLYRQPELKRYHVLVDGDLNRLRRSPFDRNK